MTREPDTTSGRLPSAVGRSPGFETLSLNRALGSVWKTLTGVDIEIVERVSPHT